MIFIANKTREIEKNNYVLKNQILKIKENIKVNKIELITHQNKSYLEKLYAIYFFEVDNKIPNIISLKQFSEDEQSIKLVKTKN